MRASRKRRQLAARIAIIERHHPGSPELPRLRAELDEARLQDIADWVQAKIAVVSLPDTGGEIGDAVTEIRKLARRMTGPDGDAA